ncbi:MAG: nucleotidyltransferase family protein [Desulfotomaculum sp.]|nr:nucleotidyltransferase family protein [Desulfotomaculum sp.]
MEHKKLNKNQIEQLKKNKTYIKDAFYVKEIGLFGSFVRDEQVSGSDVDILVEFKQGHKDFFNYMRLKHYLEQLLGREVDLVIRNAIKSRLKKNILSEVVYV